MTTEPMQILNTGGKLHFAPEIVFRIIQHTMLQNFLGVPTYLIENFYVVYVLEINLLPKGCYWAYE